MPISVCFSGPLVSPEWSTMVRRYLIAVEFAIMPADLLAVCGPRAKPSCEPSKNPTAWTNSDRRKNRRTSQQLLHDGRPSAIIRLSTEGFAEPIGPSVLSSLIQAVPIQHSVHRADGRQMLPGELLPELLRIFGAP